jgi:quinol monooxygenase YgiN
MKSSITATMILAICASVFGVSHAISSVTAAADDPVYIVTHIDVMPKFTAPGRELLKQFAAESRTDPGAVRIEVLEELNRPNHATVVEVWKSKDAYEEHLTAEHTRAYRTKLQPMLGSPFDERLHRLTTSVGDR